MKKLIQFFRAHPLLSGILGPVVAMASLYILPPGDNLQEGVMRMLLTGTMAFFLYFISGEKTLQACGEETGYVLKVASPFLIISGVLGLLILAVDIYQGVPLQKNWIQNLFIAAYMFLFVGLFEEMTFRAIINDALVYQFRNFKQVFLLSAIACSLIFGYVHVMYVPLKTPLMVAQAVGKTLSTAAFGLALLFLYWKTRNIWACGLAHGIYDFLVSCSTVIFQDMNGAKIGEYVTEGSDGISTLVMYIIQFVISVIICIRIWKKVGKSIDFEEMRENW